MALPDLIEIVPLFEPVQAEITVPGSKSITNRALILAALADGQTKLRGALWSEDTQVMVEGLRTLGFEIGIEPDAEEFCNRTIVVRGLGGKIPVGGTDAKPLELFVGNAGTAARFLSAMVCLGNGVYRLHGIARMHERPQAALFEALRDLGYEVESEKANEKLPVRIRGGGPGSEAHSRSSQSQSLLTSAATNLGRRTCNVSIEESSQFASALMLCAETGGWEIKIDGHNPEESPYVTMTAELIKAFPRNGGSFQNEPDASSGSYFWAAAWLMVNRELEYFFSSAGKTSIPEEPRTFHYEGRPELSQVRVINWPNTGWQIDADFTVFTQPLSLEPLKGATLPSEISRAHDLGDSIMTAIVLSPLVSQSVKFTEIGRLRIQESERVVGLRTELTRCGAKVVEEGDTLTVHPSKLHGAEIETYNDHRMAMCFAVLALKVPGFKIKNPSCVKKTFPNFFQKLAADPPHGLGAAILDARTGRKLSAAELFAD